MASLTTVYSVIAVLVVLFIVAGELWWVATYMSARRPDGINRRLRDPGDRHRVKLHGFPPTWNPSAPVTEPLYGRGAATYWREGDQIHLEYQPRRGQTREFAGPLPDFAKPGTRAYKIRRRIFREMLVVLVGYGAVILAGCGVGFVATSGRTSARLTGMFVGAAVAFVGSLLVLHAFTLARGLRRRGS